MRRGLDSSGGELHTQAARHRKPQHERGSRVRRAAESEITTHEPGEPPADSQAQSDSARRSPVSPAHRGLRLVKRLEHGRFVFLGDAHSGVTHLDERKGPIARDARVLGRGVRDVAPHGNGAAERCELESVGDQVEQNLANPMIVADAWHPFVAPPGIDQPYSVSLRLRQGECQRLLD